jgi:NOL1/NOP2/fmu family ribosome biogenesis protein
MSYIKILNEQEKREVEKKLNEQFGIEKIHGLILRTGEERLFLFSGDFSEKNIKNLERTVVIERTGIYFAKIIQDKIKLSIEGTQILGAQVKKNIFELKDETQLEEWMMGQDLPIKTGKRDFLVMKYKEDFLGCGKASEEKIGNFIPKSRRLRAKTR